MANQDFQIEKTTKMTKKLTPSQKIIVMRIFVAGLALIIFVIWLFNLPNVWSGNRKMLNNDSDLQSLKTDMSSFLNQSEEKLVEIKAIDEKQLKQKLIEDSNILFQDLIEEANSVTNNTTTDFIENISSTTDDYVESRLPVDGARKDLNCPAWINCMPSLDEVRNCQIPVGCEDFTQIAY